MSAHSKAKVEGAASPASMAKNKQLVSFQSYARCLKQVSSCYPCRNKSKKNQELFCSESPFALNTIDSQSGSSKPFRPLLQEISWCPVAAQKSPGYVQPVQTKQVVSA